MTTAWSSTAPASYPDIFSGQEQPPRNVRVCRHGWRGAQRGALPTCQGPAPHIPARSQSQTNAVLCTVWICYFLTTNCPACLPWSLGDSGQQARTTGTAPSLRRPSLRGTAGRPEGGHSQTRQSTGSISCIMCHHALQQIPNDRLNYATPMRRWNMSGETPCNPPRTVHLRWIFLL